MATYYAIHQIQYYEDGKVVSVAPGSIVGGLDEKELERLAELGAVSSDRPKALLDAPAPVHSAPSVQAQAAEAQAAHSREELEARAQELEVKFNKNISDEKLAERIAEAELNS